MEKNINKLFFLFNFLFTTLLGFVFLIFNKDYRFFDFLYSVGATISTSSLIFFVIFLFTFLFFRFKFMKYILFFIFFLIYILLFIDFAIYRVWGFHFNGMVLNIIFSPAAYESLYIGIKSIIIILIVFTSFFFIVRFFLRWAEKLSKEQNLKYLALFKKIGLPVLILIMLVEKLVYAYADYTEDGFILERTRTIPVYVPLRMEDTFKKYGFKRIKRKKYNIEKIVNLKYPEKKIVVNKPTNINIFIFGIDALRESIISQDITPNIYKFAKENIDFKYNISGGNCTRFGLFSLFYGINSNYWFAFLNAKKGSVLLNTLDKLKYQMLVSASVNFKWPEFRRTIFYNVQDKIKDNFEGSPIERDKKNIEYFSKWISKIDKTKPIFSFVWLDSLHARIYPKNFRNYTPDDPNEYLTMDKSKATVEFNRYKNSTSYTDYNFGKFIKILKDNDLYKNSIIILTSDHGEEFYEFGFFGHYSAYDLEQVNNPLIIHIPGRKPAVIKHMSSLLDLVPTLMKQIGVENNSRDYSHGKNLFADNYQRECTFVGNWNDDAIVCDDYTIIIKSLNIEVRDTKTYKVVKKYNRAYINKIILKYLNENKYFRK